MDPKQEHLYKLLTEFHTAMLVTETEKGHLRARPMALAEKQPDGDLYFATRVDSPKATEILHDAHVNVTLQKSDKFISISGVAELIQNPDKIAELWSEPWRAWFSGGKNDPGLALIRLRAISGEYWDESGVNKIKFLIETARAYASRTKKPHYDEDQHAKVSF